MLKVKQEMCSIELHLGRFILLFLSCRAVLPTSTVRIHGCSPVEIGEFSDGRNLSGLIAVTKRSWHLFGFSVHLNQLESIPDLSHFS